MTTIAQERQRRTNVGLVMRTRERWGSVYSYTTARPVEEPATRLFLHITVTNPDSYSSNDAHARAVERIGISRFPNTGISYNGLILPGGHLYEGQPFGRRGAHTVNDSQRSSCSTAGCPGRGTSLSAPSFNLNINSRALALARNTDDPVTDADVDAAARWGAGYKLAGMVTGSARWHGHRCVSAKSCPGDRAWTRIDDVADLTATYLRNGLPGTTPEPPPPPKPEPRKAAPMFVTRYGSTQYRLVTGDRMVDVNQSTYDKLKAAGVPAVALDNAQVTHLQGVLVSENLSTVDEEAPPVP
jgi:N-acetylmuramoyl-L-alanine amidase